MENDAKQKIVTGGQEITIEKANIVGEGLGFTQANVAPVSGNLVQVGSHGGKTVDDGHVKRIMQVQDTVTDAHLNLTDSKLSFKDPTTKKDLINVTYGEMTAADITAAGTNTIATEGKVSSQLTANALRTTMTGSMFADYTKDRNDHESELNLLMDQSTWNLNKDAEATNKWLGNDVTGNFLTTLYNNNSTINISHEDGKFHNIYVSGTYKGQNGIINMNTA